MPGAASRFLFIIITGTLLGTGWINIKREHCTGRYLGNTLHGTSHLAIKLRTNQSSIVVCNRCRQQTEYLPVDCIDKKYNKRTCTPQTETLPIQGLLLDVTKITGGWMRYVWRKISLFVIFFVGKAKADSVVMCVNLRAASLS